MVEELQTSASRAEIDYPFLKVPLEQARRVFRHSQRILEQKLGSLTKLPESPEAIEATIKIVEDLIKSIEEDKIESNLYREKCKKRIKFYERLGNNDPAACTMWNDLRIGRLVNEFLLGSFYFKTADHVATESHLKELDFSDEDIYNQLKSIEEKLDAKSTSDALLWCFENRPHLKKNSSPLEFSLRRQTFVELARKRDLSQAITYAKKFFPPWLDQFKREIEQCMALLAIPPETSLQPYHTMYSEEKWSELKSLFRREFLDLYSLPQKSQLISFVQAGLASLKTPTCGKEVVLNCPVCVPPYSEIANGLPYSHHENSTLVCRLTGSILNENNPPMILPNGHVYGLQALQDLASKHGGNVACPETGQTFKMTDARKVFIL